MSQASFRTMLAVSSGTVIFCSLLLGAYFFAVQNETPVRIEGISTTNSDQLEHTTPATTTRESDSPTLASGERTSGSLDPDSAATQARDDTTASTTDTQSVAGVTRKPPSPKTSQDEPSLSDRVVRILEEVQRRQLADQMEEALNELNALYAQYDELSPFEQATLLNFYTNTLLALEMWSESISAFTLMLTIPELRPDIRSRATLSLGQLHAREEDFDTAISYYSAWLANPEAVARTTEQETRVLGLLQAAREQTQL